MTTASKTHSAHEKPGAPAPLLAPDGAPAIEDWSVDQSLRHLNHGSCGAVPRATQARQLQLRTEMESNPNRWFRGLPGRVAEARARIAAYLGADVTQVVAVPSASGGASVVYNSLALPRGASIVVTDHCYGALRMGAERLARRSGAHVREVTVPLAADDAEVRSRIDAATDTSTALLIVDQISSATARAFPLPGIIEDAHAKGARVLVDAAHAPGAVDRPLEGSLADYWIGNLHKFACSPRGAAILFAQTEVMQELYPLIDSWGTPEPYPARFDRQGTIDVTAVLSAMESIDAIESRFRWRRVREYASDLMDYAHRRVIEALSRQGEYEPDLRPESPARPMRIVALPPGVADTADGATMLRERLADAGFETAVNAWRGQGILRLSAHVYNTADDYDLFVERGLPVILAAGR
ncbi:aminotransferase class V-fold PLP-dependent enzyme [Microbacterium sp. NPDC058342]|uniref:aminotransferase class V-fold PLP-dependent enzyme n=1 Tax=Microbacterium sp. NPDC058342 TaxID=3346454 RepID=UPI00364A5372